MNAKKKNKNPLYVVTQKGKVVQEATGLIDALIKKLGLNPVIEFFNSILNTLIAQLQSFTLIQVIIDFIEQIKQLINNYLLGQRQKG